jgi:hypothetical protein
VSLTLPQSAVGPVAAHLRCSTSSALRRIAVEHLGAQRPTTAHAPRVKVASAPAKGSTFISGQSAWPRNLGPHEIEEPQGESLPDGEAIVGALIQFLIWVLVMGASLFFTLRKKKSAKAA